MTRRSPLAPLCIHPGLAMILLIPAALAISAQAQEPLPQGISQPNFEPSSTDTLMERTDLGNVAQAARMQYGAGMRELSKAEKLRAKAASLTDPISRSKTEEKAQNSLENADKAFREALSYDEDFIPAYAGLGTALRLQNKAEEALQVHAMALRRSPEDLENFKGWTESLLALNMLGNVTGAYTDYAESNPTRAEVLMTAIENWLADKKTDPGELDPADVQRLADWVALQKQG